MIRHLKYIWEPYKHYFNFVGGVTSMRSAVNNKFQTTLIKILHKLKGKKNSPKLPVDSLFGN